MLACGRRGYQVGTGVDIWILDILVPYPQRGIPVWIQHYTSGN